MADMIRPVKLDVDEKRALAQRLVDRAKAGGVELLGPGGLLSGLTEQVLKTALEEEIVEHLGYDKRSRRPERTELQKRASGQRRS